MARVVSTMLSAVLGSLVAFADGPASAAPAPFVLHSDVLTGITSDAEGFVSLRYMRHLWVLADGVQVAVVQQGGTTGLGLYSSFDDGLSWTWEQDLPSSVTSLSDGIALSDGSLLLVVSIGGSSADADVEFLRLDHDVSAQTWSLDPLGPTTVYASNQIATASRATIAMDSNGVLWSAFRLRNANSGNYRLRLFYSVDDGVSWQDSTNVFGTANGFAEKDAKVIATGTGIAVILHDVQGTATSPVRWKAWALRSDSDPLQASMTSEPLARMVASDGDPYGSHWSVAADAAGDIHLAYQDGRIQYTRFDASVLEWSTPVSLGTQTGSYNSISVAGNDDLWVFARFASGGHLWVKRRPSATLQWSAWQQVSAEPHAGLLRMCSPERVDAQLPVLYQVNATAPFELLHALLDA